MMRNSKIFIFICAAAVFFVQELPGCRAGDDRVLENTWRGYKHFFIQDDGRVVRPADGRDTVSEGQAYAMLRAVWMDDRDIFDRCYRWTEKNLSRKKEKGDNLLAWRWKDGEVSDWMPASDADIDYALSLIFAGAKWGASQPAGLMSYGEKAQALLEDILDNLTFESGSGTLYLAPWIIDKDRKDAFPQNPSYYSPAHFRIFYRHTGDKRWLSLIDTSYFIFNSLSGGLAEAEGRGLIPDWCAVTDKDEFIPLEGKNAGFGWEAVRVPLRAGLDYLWFREERALSFLRKGFRPFLEREWESGRRVYAEYEYDGSPGNGFENPAFYSSYYIALHLTGSPYDEEFRGKVNTFLKKDGETWFYKDKDDYYTNSLAWLAEGVRAGIIKYFQQERAQDE